MPSMNVVAGTVKLSSRREVTGRDSTKVAANEINARRAAVLQKSSSKKPNFVK
jgi:hypothetical protein